MKIQYHHGNLKNEIIERGIQIISEHGHEHLSLRNLSKECGVSHNAIYRHFESKEKMIESCRSYVTTALTQHLQNTIEGLNPSDPRTINRLSYAYIEYFKKHPAYFNFIYQDKTSCKIVFSLEECSGNYPPYEIFRKLCIALIKEYGLSKEEGVKRLVKYWSLMQGVVSLIISPNVELYGNWDYCLENLFEQGCCKTLS